MPNRRNWLLLDIRVRPGIRIFANDYYDVAPGAKGNKVEEYMALDDEICAETSDPSIYPFFPCWPNKPYLSIDPKTRKAWLDRLGMPLELSNLIDAPPYRIQAPYWSSQSTLRMLKRFVTAKSLSFRDESSQWVVFQLNWNLHDKELATMFSRWLKENRPKGAKAFERRGRGTPERKGRTNLKYLSVYRLRKKDVEGRCDSVSRRGGRQT